MKQVMIDAIKQLYRDHDPIFAGSFGLWLNGLIDREPEDLDIVVDKEPVRTTDVGSDDTPDCKIKRGYLPFNPNRERHKGRLWVKIDYIVPKTPQTFSYALFEGIEIKVADPQYAIKAKEYYTRDGRYHYKHSEDLKIINERYAHWKFNNLLNTYYGGV